MPDGLRPVHEASLREVFDDFGIRLLDEQASEWLDLRSESALQVHDVPYRNALPQAQIEVVDTISRGGVHDASAVLRRNEIGVDDEERRFIRHEVFI